MQKSRSVYENDLSVVEGSRPEDAGARGVSFAGDGGDFGADEGVEKLGFSGVGRPHQGYVESFAKSESCGVCGVGRSVLAGVGVGRNVGCGRDGGMDFETRTMLEKVIFDGSYRCIGWTLLSVRFDCAHGNGATMA